MRITKIAVKGLFGMFDHEIPLNQESRITIVHGPNGVGKTVLMRMVHGLIHYDYNLLRSIPFEKMVVEFDVGDVAVISKELSYSSYLSDSQKLSIRYLDGTDALYEPFEPKWLDTDILNNEIKKRHPHLQRVAWQGESYWFNESRFGPEFRGRLTLYDAITIEYFKYEHTELFATLVGEEPAWLQDIQIETMTKMINVGRLEDAIIYGRNFARGLPSYSEKFGEEVETVHVPYPAPAIEQLDIKFDNLELNHILDARARIRQLLQISEETDDFETSEVLKSTVGQLVDRLERREYFQQLITFEDIINERLLFKSLHLMSKNEIYEKEEDAPWYTKNDGIEFLADNDETLSLSDLSSGEQHILSLYFQLIFEIPPDTLVMIDEPELSMNVVWQRNFLKDLQRIIELRKFDVLIATHSPQIIHDKWDWMVPLGEPVDD